MTSRSGRFHSFLMALLAFVLAAGVARGDGRQWTAADLFHDCITHQVRLTADRSAIELTTGTLIEDDGPAAGYSYSPNLETLDGKKQLRKTLIVPRTAARQASLLVTHGGELTFRLNGKTLDVSKPRKLGHHWQAYDFDAGLLRQGENEVVVSGRGRIWIARDDEYAAGSLTRRHHPNRSARSTDGGQTWNDRQLGNDGNVDGEYCIRLFLDQSVPQGTVETPVLDVGNLSGRGIGPLVRSVGEVKFAVELEGDAEACRVRLRSGATAVPDRDWSAWKNVATIKKGAATVSSLAGRYFQLAIQLESIDPLDSPRIKSLRIETSPEVNKDWTKRLQVTQADNPPLVRSSIDFVHEDSQHPQLKKLRRQYRLDDVVEGAKTEFETITRLAAWSSQRWPKLGHLGEIYPAWNALDILKPHADGTPVGGFCHQYNLVFLQACQSLGIPVRVVSIGPGNLTDRIRSGHETVEVWSNDHDKWVYVDGNTAWYFTDAKSGVPLSLWELRQAQLDFFAGKDVPAPKLVKLAETRYQWTGFDGFPAFVELRLVPRSNFLSQTAPLPLNQGMRGWFWTGYRVWCDERSDDREIYTHRIVKRGNFEWPLNRVHLYLQPQDKPGLLRVHIDVEMPNLKSLSATINGGKEKTVRQTFDWQLHAGRNQLSLVPVNQSDRRGRTSRIEITFEE